MADSGVTLDRRREETGIPPDVYKSLLKAAGHVKFNFDEETLLAGLQEHGIEHKQHCERARYKSPEYSDIRGHKEALSIILGKGQPAKGKQSASKQQTAAATASQANRQTPGQVLGAVSAPTNSVSAFTLEHEGAESVSASPATSHMADALDQPQQAGQKYAMRSAQRNALAPTPEIAATPETLRAAWVQGASAEAEAKQASPIQPTVTPETRKFVSYNFGDSGQTGEAAQAKAGQGSGTQEHRQHDTEQLDIGTQGSEKLEATARNQPCASKSEFQLKLRSAVSKHMEAFMTHVQQDVNDITAACQAAAAAKDKEWQAVVQKAYAECETSKTEMENAVGRQEKRDKEDAAEMAWDQLGKVIKKQRLS